MKKRKPWIIAHDATKGRDAYMLECMRCGEKQRFTSPIELDVWCAAAEAFRKAHSCCKGKSDDSDIREA